MMRRREGFTLIELILGLSLLSVVMLTIYSVFWGGVRLSYKTDASQEVYRQAYWSLDVMSREIENMVKYNLSESYPERFSFMGTKDKITFMAPTPNGLKAVSYFLLAEESGKVHKTIVNYQAYKKNVRVTLGDSQPEQTRLLVRRQTDFPDFVTGQRDADITDDDDLEVIAIHVKPEGLRFSYSTLGVAEENEAASVSWADEWEGNDLPLSVRIELNLVPPDNPDGIVTFDNEVLIPPQVWSRLR